MRTHSSKAVLKSPDCAAFVLYRKRNQSLFHNLTFENSDPCKDFHTYFMEWAQGEIRWYVEDTHFATQRASGWFTQMKDDPNELYNVEGTAPFDQPFHLLLNLAVGGNWPGKPDKTVTKKRRAKRDFGKQPPAIINMV